VLVPLALRRAPAAVNVPCATLSVVWSTGLSTSATERPAIGSTVSSSTVCAGGTVLAGTSFTAWTVIGTVSVSLREPSEVTTVSVSPPWKLGSPR